jgi:Uma2 family endonuclease
MQDKTPPSEVSMAHLAQRAATYEDLLAVPEHLVAEILFGELVTHPRPAPRHAIAGSALGGVLAPPFQFGSGGPGGWIFIGEPELHLGPHVAVPDLAAWRRERLPSLPETAWIGIAPDWICEVLSPSTQSYDRGEKRTIYAEAGVGHLWHVDPVLRMLEVFELREGKWLLLDVFHDNANVTAQPFAQVSFSLGLLWPFDPPVEAQGSSGG